jgi:hypothetical protein
VVAVLHKKNKIVIWDIQNREGIIYEIKRRQYTKENQKALIKGALMGII